MVSNSLWSQGLQHTRLLYPSLSPGACSNSGPLSQWCHPTIASSVIPFSSCLQSFPASGSFPVSRLFTSGGQSIGASASASVLLIQDWFPLGWTGWISLQSKGLSRVFSNTTVRKHQFFGTQPSLLRQSPLLKPGSSAKFMINLSIQNVIHFLVQYLFPSRLRSIKEEGDWNQVGCCGTLLCPKAFPCPPFLIWRGNVSAS